MKKYLFIDESSLKDICNKIEDTDSLYTVKFDGTVSKSYKFSVEKEMRVFSKGKFAVNKIKFVSSKNDSLIQLADMYAGIIRRNMEDHTESTKEIYGIIRDKIM